MTINEVHNYYDGNWSEACRELKLGKNTTRYWVKIGYIPMPAQLRIEQTTRGQLVADVHKKEA